MTFVSKQNHFTSLENMYLSSPVAQLYPPIIHVSDSNCSIEIDVKPEYFHAAGAVHGSVYFKLLDDAAFFSANSKETEVFVLTTSFTTYLTRPISEGKMRAEGKLVNSNRSQFIAEAVVYDENNREIARGNGLFVRSKVNLSSIEGYKA